MEKIKVKKQEISYPLIIGLISWVYSLCLICIVLYYNNKYGYYNNKFDINKDVNFNETIDELNQSIIKDIILLIKPEYLDSIKSIYVTNDPNFIGIEYLGRNNNREIIIYYNNNYKFLNILAHEICHNYSPNEEFCFDIGNYPNIFMKN